MHVLTMKRIALICCIFHPMFIFAGQVRNTSLSGLHGSPKIKSGYIVHSPSCDISDISPYHSSIKYLIRKKKPVACSRQTLLTEIQYNGKTGLRYLVLRRELVKSHTRATPVKCCYSTIYRKYQQSSRKRTDDDRYTLTKKKCFTNRVTLPPTTEFVYVKCGPTMYHPLYVNVHSIVVDKFSTRKSKGAKTKFSVLLFSIDSVSRLNFIRAMPQTHAYVNSNNWIPLEGYTKVGLNTLPNILPILTGQTRAQLDQKCYDDERKIDGCPYIWKEYKKQSYVTGYLEDEPKMSTFNYKKYGFLNSPTDYYMRPMLMAARRLMKIRSIDGEEYCVGPKSYADHIYEYSEEIIKRNRNNQYFHIMWLNSFSHKDVNSPSMVDARTKRFLQSIEPYLANTIVVFFSDHGVRFGKFRQTFVGWWEERLPFIYFRLPPAFKKLYPKKYENLKVNKNRLTSPFDLHATLKDILYNTNTHPKGCPKCHSLFQPMSWNRSCADAAIPDKWCVCSSDYETVSTKIPDVKAGAKVAVGHINSLLKNRKKSLAKGTKCAALSLKEIRSARTKISRAKTSSGEYVITFVTKPGDAVFEAVVKKQGNSLNVADSINRVNAYKSQSYCTNHSALDYYCFCVKT